MPSNVKHLLIGSTEAFSGKSATVLGLALQLQSRGLVIAYGKPVGTCLNGVLDGSADIPDPDIEFVAKTLNLPEQRLRKPLLSLNVSTIEDQLNQQTASDVPTTLGQYCQSVGGDLMLLEGPGSLDEGTLFNLSIGQIADAIDAPILLVARYHSALVVDALLSAKQRLGSRLLGVLINDIPEDQMEQVETRVRPYLERQGIPVFALMPRTPLMRSISVGRIVDQLHAEVLCCSDRLGLMVETLTIGAMNVNSALRYFRKGINMAVVTGGDRTDIQLAALETSTHCLVLTGHLPPSKEIIARATDLEVPILSVDSDTLTTVELIDQMFGQIRLHEPAKVACVQDLMEHHLDLERLLDFLQIKLPVAAS